MDYSLGANVHEAARGHLAVAGYTKGGHFRVVVLAGVIGDDHAVGDHHPGRVRV